MIDMYWQFVELCSVSDAIKREAVQPVRVTSSTRRHDKA